MKPIKNVAIILAFGLLLAYGCYPGGPSGSDDYTIVRTQYNTAYDFGSKKTYFMADSMKFSTNVDEESIDQEALATYEATLLNEINKNMELRGYERITDSATLVAEGVDLVILPGAVLAQNTGASWWPGPGWWGGYYPPGWGWGGGWYYPPGYGGYWSYYSYTTGTVIVNICDYDSYVNSEGEYIEIEWDALVDGLLKSVTADKIGNYIGQAFEQSPYLKSN